jgi:predicted AlkP superfamily pyrophosphatase or phosphodiesterase
MQQISPKLFRLKMWCFLVILFLLNTTLILAQSIPLLLLVSFDGFRHDYPKIHGPLKNFRRLEERGVHAHKMISTFTTATFPNHYTYVPIKKPHQQNFASDQ